MYYAGSDGAPCDYDLAFRCLVAANAGGHTKAGFVVGLMYYQGKGVAEDKAKASEYYYAAAMKGDADGIRAFCATAKDLIEHGWNDTNEAGEFIPQVLLLGFHDSGTAKNVLVDKVSLDASDGTITIICTINWGAIIVSKGQTRIKLLMQLHNNEYEIQDVNVLHTDGFLKEDRREAVKTLTYLVIKAMQSK
jgi:TPR repeat protein